MKQVPGKISLREAGCHISQVISLVKGKLLAGQRPECANMSTDSDLKPQSHTDDPDFIKSSLIQID